MKDILVKHFDCKYVEEVSENSYVTDLYWVWECWCSNANEILNISHFNMESLNKDIKKLVELDD